ncbi:hypothetical protein TorRG33x02_356420 [Trema orientale]|uniref:Uncharacterized protein n=1 Tax=Trema orientale TaxID=63057 RepID=A0A2P5A787_TREOI|nr:hypothetical protein TorRG33x02_356420 [Trema orientale]
MDYAVDAIQRIEAAYVKLFEDIRNVEGEIVAFREESRRSEEDRRLFYKAVLSAVLCRSKSGGHSVFYGEEDVQMDAEAKEASMPPNIELRIEDDDEVGGKRSLKSSNKVTLGNDDVQILGVRKQASASHNPTKRFKEAAVGGKKSGGSSATRKQGSSRKAVGVTKIGPFTLVNALQYHEEVAVVDYVFNGDLQGE